jgi:hypothetical protein
VRKADNLTPCVSRLPRKCGSLELSQPSGLSRPLTGIALPLFLPGMMSNTKIYFRMFSVPLSIVYFVARDGDISATYF